ncbi:probable malate dehydrogenase, mitochondrial [Nasonia vitripennis]|uniref:malate dehydrogenase n=1 Tax=Nasonia vitripennis TaxID=7425 RepID=A0A7M7GA25_NASVI|nr:probable malate dehydrogenase, mitochondrial [Nasonia vitripennis]
MLLKQNPAIKEIRLIDTDNSLMSPVCDMRHIDTSTTIRHFRKNSILDGLRNTDIVALMDETDFMMGNKGPFMQFVNSSNYVKSVAECMINVCPKALVAVFTHPVTATLPLVSEIYKYSGDWDPNRIFGSAALESMRISAMTATLLDLNPSFISVPIAGGIDSLTVVPLLSRARPFNSFTEENECLLIHQLRSADMKLFETETKGPTLSSGMAAAKFISTLINGMKKQSISITSAYVRSDVLPSCQYMTSEIQFGPNGVQQNFGLPKVSPTEISMIGQAAPVINKIVKSAIKFLHTGKIK